jgi:hypothetical protein
VHDSGVFEPGVSISVISHWLLSSDIGESSDRRDSRSMNEMRSKAVPSSDREFADRFTFPHGRPGRGG